MSIYVAGMVVAVMAGACIGAVKSTIWTYKKIRNLIRINKAKTGKDINSIDKKGRTRLMTAKTRKECQFLLENGCDINAVDPNGNTALMHIKDPKIMAFLGSNGADINAVNKDGKSALILRAEEGNDAAIEALLKMGASTSVSDKSKKPLWHYYLKGALDNNRIITRTENGERFFLNKDIFYNLMDQRGREEWRKSRKINMRVSNRDSMYICDSDEVKNFLASESTQYREATKRTMAMQEHMSQQKQQASSKEDMSNSDDAIERAIERKQKSRQTTAKKEATTKPVTRKRGEEKGA